MHDIIDIDTGAVLKAKKQLNKWEKKFWNIVSKQQVENNSESSSVKPG